MRRCWRVGVLVMGLVCFDSVAAQGLDLELFVPAKARQAAKVVQADVNGDGALEAVVFYSSEERGIVLVLSPSDQTELTRTEVDLADADGFDLAPVDFNGDGAAELVVTGVFGDGYITSYTFFRWEGGHLAAIPVLDEGANEVLVDSVATAEGPTVRFQDVSGDGATDLVIDSLRVSGDVVVQIQDVYRFSASAFLFQPDLGLVTANDLPIISELAGTWLALDTLMERPQLIINVLPDLTGYDLEFAGALDLLPVPVADGTTLWVPERGRVTQLRLSDPAGAIGVLTYDTATPDLLQISGFGDLRDGTYRRLVAEE